MMKNWRLPNKIINEPTIDRKNNCDNTYCTFCQKITIIICYAISNYPAIFLCKTDKILVYRRIEHMFVKYGHMSFFISKAHWTERDSLEFRFCSIPFFPFSPRALQNLGWSTDSFVPKTTNIATHVRTHISTSANINDNRIRIPINRKGGSSDQIGLEMITWTNTRPNIS